MDILLNVVTQFFSYMTLQDECVGTITQVISVLFKGRSAESIRNRLGAMFDAVPSESSSSSDDALSDVKTLFISYAVKKEKFYICFLDQHI